MSLPARRQTDPFLRSTAARGIVLLPALPFHCIRVSTVDAIIECKTADDVRQSARRAAAFRKALSPPTWHDKKRFEALIRAAYPQEYPKQIPLGSLIESAYPAFYPGPRDYSCRAIMTAISNKFKISIPELLSDRRQADLVWARQIGWGLSRYLTSMSFPEIARIWQKHHTTLMYGCKKVEPIIERVAAIVPMGAPCEHWVATSYWASREFPQIYPYAACGSSKNSRKNLVRKRA